MESKISCSQVFWPLPNLGGTSLRVKFWCQFWALLISIFFFFYTVPSYALILTYENLKTPHNFSINSHNFPFQGEGGMCCFAWLFLSSLKIWEKSFLLSLLGHILISIKISRKKRGKGIIVYWHGCMFSFKFFKFLWYLRLMIDEICASNENIVWMRLPKYMQVL